MSDLDFVRQRLKLVDELLAGAASESEPTPSWKAPLDPLGDLAEPRRSPTRLLALERQLLLRLLDECRVGQVRPTLDRWLARSGRIGRGAGGQREAAAFAGAGPDLTNLAQNILVDMAARLERWTEAEANEL